MKGIGNIFPSLHHQINFFFFLSFILSKGPRFLLPFTTSPRRSVTLGSFSGSFPESLLHHWAHSRVWVSEDSTHRPCAHLRAWQKQNWTLGTNILCLSPSSVIYKHVTKSGHLKLPRHSVSPTAKWSKSCHERFTGLL